MADSDFWRELAEKFRAIDDPMGLLIAEWKSTEQPNWALVHGRHPSLSAQFRPLALRGGTKIDPGRDSLAVWLDAIRTEGFFLQGQVYNAVNASSSLAATLVACSIHNLVRTSADYCNILEARALESERIAEQQEQQRKDPKNWSPLRQQWEAHKEIRKLVQGQHEEIPEALVRQVLAGQYGIRSEDVTWTQISFEVSALLPHYPAITVIPSQPSSQSEESAQFSHVTSSNKDCQTKRRRKVDEFLEKCNEQSSVRIIRRHIWQSVGHSKGRQFEYWQACDEKKTTSEDSRNFSRILRMDPNEFLALLKQKSLVPRYIT